MFAEFDDSPPACPKNQPADPWAAATLSRDRSQHAWLISYIDILLLLMTLLVVLVAVQKHPAEQNVSAEAAPVANLSQPSPTEAAPQLMSLPAPPADSSAPELRDQEATPEAAPVATLPQPSTTGAAPELSFLSTPHADSSAPELVDEEASSSVVPEPTSVTEASPGADEKVPSAPEPPTASVSRTVLWEPPDDLKEQVDITRTAEHIRLEVKDTFLFESGSADLKPQATTVLDSLIGLLQRHPGGIAVEGHTDDQPIATARYPSNWELSAARASAVARYLITHGIAAQRVQAVGHADTRPRSSNDSAEGRARNRRVTLVMYPQP